ncbi:hypothetical protein JYT85_01430 [Desulfocapsa sp. AH-315-G09]|nr:hypothetical protein [Desulfocapsa sp.]MBN4065289.1 hypothetical protein [Desulfocapsa sp. AH-315-G09]
MKLICPGCGSVASAEIWLNDALCRETMAAIVSLPHPLPGSTIGYVSLFRPGKRALTWKKAKRLVNELAVLVTTGHIQVQGKVARPCPPGIWALAMEQMVERRDSLRLPMPNHNYLKQIVWELADREDAGQEKTIRQQESQGQRPTQRGVDPLEKARQEWDKNNAGKAVPGLPDFVIKGMGNEKD